MILKIGFEEEKHIFDLNMIESDMIADVVFTDGNFLGNNTSAVLGRAIVGTMVLGMGV
jgi:hypothetical protein